jgi:hypothetical protein
MVRTPIGVNKKACLTSGLVKSRISSRKTSVVLCKHHHSSQDIPSLGYVVTCYYSPLMFREEGDILTIGD